MLSFKVPNEIVISKNHNTPINFIVIENKLKCDRPFCNVKDMDKSYCTPDKYHFLTFTLLSKDHSCKVMHSNRPKNIKHKLVFLHEYSTI